MERWQRPPVVLAVDPDEQVYETANGRLFRNARLTVDADTSERLRLGYMCANCLQQFEIPWPVRCHFCGVYVREQQAEIYEKQFRGVEIFQPTDWDAEIARMRDEIGRTEKEQRR